MDTDNAINQRRTTFKLNKEFVDLDLLDRSIVKEDSDWPWEARIQCRSLECPLRRDNEDALPTLDVVAEALVILISTDTEEDGYHVRARARLVYAEFKTKDEWTRTRVAPAAAVSVIHRLLVIAPNLVTLTSTSATDRLSRNASLPEHGHSPLRKHRKGLVPIRRPVAVASFPSVQLSTATVVSPFR